MSTLASRTVTEVYEIGRGTMNMRYLRLVELSAYFVIVFGAQFIAAFYYPSVLFALLFAGTTLFQYFGGALCEIWGRARGWTRITIDANLLWFSSFLDLFIVVGIIYLTGTIESPFLFLLIVPIFFCSHIFSWKITSAYFLSGAIGSVAVLGYLELRETIPHFNCYFFKEDVYLNGHYYVGTLLVLTAFLSLVLYLSTVFQDHFKASLDKLRKKGKESEDRLLELTRLYDISLGINSVISLETLLKMVAKEATLLLGQPWASIFLFNADSEITNSVFVGIPETHGVRLPSRVRTGGLTEWIIKNRRPVVVGDVFTDKRARTGEFLLAAKIRSLIAYPLTSGRNVIGAFYAGDFVKQKFDDNQVRKLAILSDQLSTAIEKSRLYESIQRKIGAYEKRIENLEKVNNLKSEFVSNVSHELKTPLTSIKAYVEILQTHMDDPSFKERNDFLNIVAKETERLIRIVNEILDVSKIEFGQRPIQRSVFRLSEVIDEVKSMMHPSLVERKMKLVTDLSEHLPKVDADKDLVTQVFINLVTNAIKYSPEGKTITIQAWEEAVSVCVAVKDEGIGIPEPEIENIFNKYFRAGSKKAGGDGVGLGLAIVKNIIEQHGGKISVESVENVGSKFTFSIPKEHCFNDFLGCISEIVSSRQEIHEMLDVIVRMIAELLSVKIVSLMLLHQNKSDLFIKVSYGLDEWVVEQTRVKVGEGIAGRVAATGVPLLISNIEQNDVCNCPNNPQYETMSLLSVPLMVNNTVIGVINVNNKTSGQPLNQDDMSLLISFGERISTALERFRTAEKPDTFLQDTIEAFKKLLERKNQIKGIEKVVDLALKLSRKIGLTEKEVRVIQYVASVHDIGMTKISDEILDKTLTLTPEETKRVQAHPREGAELIRPLEFVELVSNIILYHHERVDGLGYPMGLKGDQIPIGSRMLAVIDAYQAMTNDKPYREKMTSEEAVREIVECAGKQFDAEVVECFISLLRDESEFSAEQADEFLRMLKGIAQSSPY